MHILKSIIPNGKIDFSLESILSFLDKEMDDEEKVKNYFERKFKDTKELFVISFESLNPIKLKVSDRYNFDELSLPLKMSEDIFHPLFLSYNITNNQYKKVKGEKDGKDFGDYNRGSFSDYYLSRKINSKGFDISLKLKLDDDIEYGKIKKSILNEYYRLFNEEIKKYNGVKDTGIEFIINFNSISELEDTSDDEKGNFVKELFKEYGYKFPNDMSNDNLNGVFYLLESIDFQSKTLLGLKQKDDELIKLEDLLQTEVDPPFEMPTGEKKTLKNKRIPKIKSENDLPKITLFELILLRFLVVLINKQGKMTTSGFEFKVSDGESPVSNIDKSMRVTSDLYGNMSLLSFNLENLKDIHEFKKKIMDEYLKVFNNSIGEDDGEKVFWAKLLTSVKPLYSNQTREEQVISLIRERKHIKASKMIYDDLFSSIGTRILSDEKDTKLYWKIIDLLFIINVLTRKESNIKNELKRVVFLTNKLKANDLSKKENLSNEELYFLLGATASMACKNSRNLMSLRKNFLKQSRVQDILALISKRMESGLDEIDYLPMVGNWMNVVTTHISKLEEKKNLSHTEKFAYVAGFLSETKTNNSQEENSNEEK